MKKIMLMLITIIILMTSTTTTTKAYIVTQKNTACLKAKITSIEKNKKTCDITVKVTQRGNWKNNYYSMRISRAELRRWIKEEGKVNRGTKVEVWLYKNNTKSIYDDEFIHIMKR